MGRQWRELSMRLMLCQVNVANFRFVLDHDAANLTARGDLSEEGTDLSPAG
jgi:hypothetical protein